MERQVIFLKGDLCNYSTNFFLLGLQNKIVETTHSSVATYVIERDVFLFSRRMRSEISTGRNVSKFQWAETLIGLDMLYILL